MPSITINREESNTNIADFKDIYTAYQVNFPQKSEQWELKDWSNEEFVEMVDRVSSTRVPGCQDEQKLKDDWLHTVEGVHDEEDEDEEEVEGGQHYLKYAR